MSGEKRYTQRDLVLAQRKAFQAAINAYAPCSLHPNEIIAISKQCYPLPKVTRPRVVRDTAGDEWRIKDDRLEIRWANSTHWVDARVVTDIDVRTLRRLADLLANPTETVEDTE